MMKSFPNNSFLQLTNFCQSTSLARTRSVNGVFLSQMEKKIQDFSSSFTSLAFPTKGERANNIHVTIDLPSEQKHQKG